MGGGGGETHAKMGLNAKDQGFQSYVVHSQHNEELRLPVHCLLAQRVVLAHKVRRVAGRSRVSHVGEFVVCLVRHHGQVLCGNRIVQDQITILELDLTHYTELCQRPCSSL